MGSLLTKMVITDFVSIIACIFLAITVISVFADSSLTKPLVIWDCLLGIGVIITSIIDFYIYYKK